MPVVVEIAVTALALRGRHDHASRANHAVADTVAGFHHGVDGFLLGLRIRLVQDRVMLGRVEILAFFAELLDAELFERLVDLAETALKDSSISLCSRMRSMSSSAGSSAVSTSMMPCWRKLPAPSANDCGS